MIDGQGLSNSDTVSIIVHPDPLVLNLVEITFTVGVSALTEAQVQQLQQKLMLLLGNNMKLLVRDLRQEQKTGEAILIFYVEQVVSTSDDSIKPIRFQTIIASFQFADGGQREQDNGWIRCGGDAER